jgi:predicted ArsR family transcriptional regulator
VARENWTFLGHHAHVLIAVNKNPDFTIDELAQILGVTTRSVVNVLQDLVAGGYLTKVRSGRRNHYEINLQAPLRHLTSRDKTVGDLIEHLGKFE